MKPSNQFAGLFYALVKFFNRNIAELGGMSPNRDQSFWPDELPGRVSLASSAENPKQFFRRFVSCGSILYHVIAYFMCTKARTSEKH